MSVYYKLAIFLSNYDESEKIQILTIQCDLCRLMCRFDLYENADSPSPDTLS
ncbi:hypothetical protein T07_6124 [Trichinella nelsoni]|uniref:Uncharacterized protein n=1 Tax=Trichinella nelsoni TaxID=6336 RepID=A0A0V0RHP3_9BILA|nr:hypothetical protein T07_6124 [Trichinella nelsoni]